MFVPRISEQLGNVCGFSAYVCKRGPFLFRLWFLWLRTEEGVGLVGKFWIGVVM